MVATGSLSSKNPASISELLDHGFYPGSLLNDFDYWDYVVPEPNLNEVVFEETTCQSLVKMLENCLSKSKHTKLGCSRVLVPEKLTQRIAQDVLRLSSTEPCGLRGCVMHVNLEIENISDSETLSDGYGMWPSLMPKQGERIRGPEQKQHLSDDVTRLKTYSN